MVSDSEPRYRLVDSNGNVVGSLYAESDGTLKLQEGTSGSDNELAFGTDGSLSVVNLDITGKSENIPFDDPSTNSDVDLKYVGNTTVGTSSTQIYQGNGDGESLVFVQGHEEGERFTTFADVILFSRDAPLRTIESTASGSAARSYSSTTNDTRLDLAMDSGTYVVNAIGFSSTVAY